MNRIIFLLLAAMEMANIHAQRNLLLKVEEWRGGMNSENRYLFNTEQELRLSWGLSDTNTGKIRFGIPCKIGDVLTVICPEVDGVYSLEAATATSLNNESYVATAILMNVDLTFNVGTNGRKISLSSGNAASVSSLRTGKEIRAVEYFDLLGRKIVGDGSKNKILIRKTIYTDGSSLTEKVLKLD